MPFPGLKKANFPKNFPAGRKFFSTIGAKYKNFPKTNVKKEDVNSIFSSIFSSIF